MAKKKFYVVWKGYKTGVFSSWESCKKQISGFKNAQYMAFSHRAEAELALTRGYSPYKGKKAKKSTGDEKEKKMQGSPILESISVDAACSGNPGKMEYRGVLTHNKRQIFIKGPYENGTNNIGEFLALVHGIALLKSKKMHHTPIYSDSKIAIGWVRKKKCKTTISFSDKKNPLYNLIVRAEKWLQENSFDNPILKWETKAWGEIPADFGRK